MSDEDPGLCHQMPDPNPDKFGEIFALPLCQIPTNLPKIGRRPVANPDKNDAPWAEIFSKSTI